MKIKKYITVRFLVKMALFLVLLGGAWLFDHFHKQSQYTAAQSVPVGQGSKTLLISFACTTTSPLSLKAPFQKTTHNKLFREKLNLFHTGQINSRTYHTLKAESLKQPNSQLVFRNLLDYRYHFLHHPDDQPPVC